MKIDYCFDIHLHILKSLEVLVLYSLINIVKCKYKGGGDLYKYKYDFISSFSFYEVNKTPPLFKNVTHNVD
jgi:hypothetical protein